MSTTHHRPRARTEAGRRAAVVGIGLSLALTVAAVAPRVVQADAPSAATAANGDVDETVQVNAAQTSTFAYDAGGSATKVIEFTTNTQATLVRHPYVIDPVSGNLVQDASRRGVLAESHEVSDDGLRYTISVRAISPAGNGSTPTMCSGRTSASRRHHLTGAIADEPDAHRSRAADAQARRVHGGDRHAAELRITCSDARQHDRWHL